MEVVSAAEARNYRRELHGRVGVVSGGDWHRTVSNLTKMVIKGIDVEWVDVPTVRGC